MDDAITFVRGAQPTGALEWSDSLAMVAKAHCDDLGPKGTMSNYGTDGSSYLDRMARFGMAGFYHGENISYGPEIRGQNIILNLLIDDGNELRGNRLNMLRSNFNFTGIATCDHIGKGKMTVINYSESWDVNLAGRLAVETYAQSLIPKKAPVPIAVEKDYWNCHKPD